MPGFTKRFFSRERTGILENDLVNDAMYKKWPPDLAQYAKAGDLFNYSF